MPEKTYELKIERDDVFESPRSDYDIGTMLCHHNRYSLGDEEDISTWQILERIAEEFDIETTNEDGEEVTEEELYERVMNIDASKGIVLPLSLYDHSGITMSVGVHNSWDSGQVGFIFATKERLLEHSGRTEEQLFSSDEIVRKAQEADLLAYLDDEYVISDFKDNKFIAKGAEGDIEIDINDVIYLKKDSNYIAFGNYAKAILEGEVETYDTYLRRDIYYVEYTEYDIYGDEVETDSCGGFYGNKIKQSGILDMLPQELREVVEKEGSKWCFNYEDGITFKVETNEFEITDEIKRKAIDELTERDVKSILEDAKHEDYSFVASVIKGDDFTQYNKLSVKELDAEYKEAFGKSIEEVYKESEKLSDTPLDEAKDNATKLQTQ